MRFLIGRIRTLGTLMAILALSAGIVWLFSSMGQAKGANTLALTSPLVTLTPMPTATSTVGVIARYPTAWPTPPTPLPAGLVFDQTPAPDPAYMVTPMPTPTPVLFPGIQLASEIQLSPKGSAAEVGSDSSPIWSPDGSKIAFLRSFHRPGDWELWVMSRDGSDQTRLANFASDPTWSPDGKQLVFNVTPQGAAGSELWVVNQQTREKRKIADLDQRAPRAPQWIGTKIYFVTGGRIRISSPEGVDLAEVSNVSILGPARGAGGLEKRFRMSPDGSSIAIWESNTLSVGSATTGVLKKVGEQVPQDEFQWSPDGRKIAWISDLGAAPSLWLANADGSGPTKVVEASREHWRTISWNPTKGLLSLMRSPTGTYAEYFASSIFLLTADGKTSGYLAPVAYGRMYAKWSPDGSRIVFAKAQTEAGNATMVEKSTLWLGVIQ